MFTIPYGRQHITASDIAAVVDVLGSDYLTQGPLVAAFEQALCQYCGTEFGVAVNSATSALHIACLALDVGPGDTVWTSPNSFVASANCARYCGADVDFVDIDPHTYNLCADALAAKLNHARDNKKPLPKVVIVVHFAGQCADIRSISELSDEYGFQIIEDASHAVGARYLGSAVGSCHYSEITVFSFHPVKIITSAEGGMALTRCEQLYDRMSQLRTHGVVKPGKNSASMSEPWAYEQHSLGFNYRMTDLHAALGLSQLNRLDSYIAHRHKLARRYHTLLKNSIYGLPYQAPDSHSSLHLYPVVINSNNEAGHNRAALFDHMRSESIGVNVHYIPIHTQPYYQALGYGWGDFPNAEAYYRGTVSLPIYGCMTYEEQDAVVRQLMDFQHSSSRIKAA